jgi:DNA primase catalytic subunit
MLPNRQQVIEYYSNDAIVKELLKNAKDREVAGAFMDGTYDKRPNIIQFPSDVIQMARKGITSFHLSVEHWSNPMAITTENYERLRTGWDMLIDIDSKLGIDESKTAAVLICNLLRKYGIRNFGMKFSGRRGFHISLSSRMFPKEIDFTPVEKKYPEVPRIIAGFIRHKIRDDLLKELVKSKGAAGLIEILGDSPSELDPFYFVEVEKDWGSRHMFRAPYSFNEKTWRVSVPLNFASLKNFAVEDAEYDKVLSNSHPEFFLGEKEEATDLLMDAIDWFAARKKEEIKTEKKPLIKWEKKVPEEIFPPCIKYILAGLEDGKKRSVFTLTSFLRMMNWTPEEIEERLIRWNEANKKPLMRNVLVAQMRWNQTNERTPANCFNDQFYKSFGACQPDEFCIKMNSKKVSNPMAYPFRKMKLRRTIRPKVRGFSCGVCNKEFKNPKSLEIHKGRMH